MNEFYNPSEQNNQSSPVSLKKESSSSVTYAEPDNNINIVVADNNTYSDQQNSSFAENSFCANCGTKLSGNDIFCPSCGTKVGAAPTYGGNAAYNRVYQQNYRQNTGYVPNAPGIKDRNLAIVLAVFFGWAGIHRFYEGKIGTGLLWLFSGGLGGIGWIVDIIILALKPDRYYRP